MRLIDQAARALAQADGNEWDGLDPARQQRFRDGVHAVLVALRDPDDIMAEAGAEIIRSVGSAESHAAHLSDAVNTWRYMMDALQGGRR